jgi:hypothetical protein
MKNKSKCRIPLRPWPPAGTKARSLSTDDVAMNYHSIICHVFPRYERLLDEMVNHLPVDVILLNLGNDVPEFLRKKLVDKLKRG